MRFIFLCLLLPLGCATTPTSPAVSRSSATQLNKNQAYAHDSSGDILNGPSYINQRVYGQRDAAGNVHVATDGWFLERADQLARAQISMAQLAAHRCASQAVSQLADRLADEQRKLDDRVRSEAAQRRIKLTSRIASSEYEAYQRLSALSGDEFDRAYLDASRELSREQLAVWDDVLQATNDQRVSQLAFDTRPRLQSDYAEIDRTHL